MDGQAPLVTRRSMLGTLSLSAASLVGISGCGESFEKRELSELGATVFAKVLGGNPGGKVAGAELILTMPGHYLVEVFDTSGISDGRNQSLKKVEFDVSKSPHRECLPDWEPASSVLLHIACLDTKGKLKTQALGLPEVLTILS